MNSSGLIKLTEVPRDVTVRKRPSKSTPSYTLTQVGNLLKLFYKNELVSLPNKVKEYPENRHVIRKEWESYFLNYSALELIVINTGMFEYAIVVIDFEKSELIASGELDPNLGCALYQHSKNPSIPPSEIKHRFIDTHFCLLLNGKCVGYFPVSTPGTNVSFTYFYQGDQGASQSPYLFTCTAEQPSNTNPITARARSSSSPVLLLYEGELVGQISPHPIIYGGVGSADFRKHLTIMSVFKGGSGMTLMNVLPGMLAVPKYVKDKSPGQVGRLRLVGYDFYVCGRKVGRKNAWWCFQKALELGCDNFDFLKVIYKEEMQRSPRPVLSRGLKEVWQDVWQVPDFANEGTNMKMNGKEFRKLLVCILCCQKYTEVGIGRLSRDVVMFGIIPFIDEASYFFDTCYQYLRWIKEVFEIGKGSVKHVDAMCERIRKGMQLDPRRVEQALVQMSMLPVVIGRKKNDPKKLYFVKRHFESYMKRMMLGEFDKFFRKEVVKEICYNNCLIHLMELPALLMGNVHVLLQLKVAKTRDGILAKIPVFSTQEVMKVSDYVHQRLGKQLTITFVGLVTQATHQVHLLTKSPEGEYTLLKRVLEIVIHRVCELKKLGKQILRKGAIDQKFNLLNTTLLRIFGCLLCKAANEEDLGGGSELFAGVKSEIMSFLQELDSVPFLPMKYDFLHFLATKHKDIFLESILQNDFLFLKHVVVCQSMMRWLMVLKKVIGISKLKQAISLPQAMVMFNELVLSFQQTIKQGAQIVKPTPIQVTNWWKSLELLFELMGKIGTVTEVLKIKNYVSNTTNFLNLLVSLCNGKELSPVYERITVMLIRHLRIIAALCTKGQISEHFLKINADQACLCILLNENAMDFVQNPVLYNESYRIIELIVSKFPTIPDQKSTNSNVWKISPEAKAMGLRGRLKECKLVFDISDCLANPEHIDITGESFLKDMTDPVAYLQLLVIVKSLSSRKLKEKDPEWIWFKKNWRHVFETLRSKFVRPRDDSHLDGRMEKKYFDNEFSRHLYEVSVDYMIFTSMLRLEKRLWLPGDFVLQFLQQFHLTLGDFFQKAILVKMKKIADDISLKSGDYKKEFIFEFLKYFVSFANHHQFMKGGNSKFHTLMSGVIRRLIVLVPKEIFDFSSTDLLFQFSYDFLTSVGKSQSRVILDLFTAIVYISEDKRWVSFPNTTVRLSYFAGVLHFKGYTHGHRMQTIQLFANIARNLVGNTTQLSSLFYYFQAGLAAVLNEKVDSLITRNSKEKRVTAMEINREYEAVIRSLKELAKNNSPMFPLSIMCALCDVTDVLSLECGEDVDSKSSVTAGEITELIKHSFEKMEDVNLEFNSKYFRKFVDYQFSDNKDLKLWLIQTLSKMVPEQAKTHAIFLEWETFLKDGEEGLAKLRAANNRMKKDGFTFDNKDDKKLFDLGFGKSVISANKFDASLSVSHDITSSDLISFKSKKPEIKDFSMSLIDDKKKNASSSAEKGTNKDDFQFSFDFTEVNEAESEEKEKNEESKDGEKDDVFFF